MPISMIITQAGLNSLSQGGTTRIASLGLGTTSYTPTDQATSLRDEIKRLPAAGVTAGSLIKVSVTDDSSASYTCREIGLFDADDVLIAVYSQSAAIVQKSATSSALIAIDIAFDNGLAQNIVFGDTDFAFPTANTTTAGISRLATLEDANNQIAGAVVDGDVLSGYIDQKSSSSIDQDNDQQLATSAAIYQLKALIEENTQGINLLANRGYIKRYIEINYTPESSNHSEIPENSEIWTWYETTPDFISAKIKVEFQRIGEVFKLTLWAINLSEETLIENPTSKFNIKINPIDVPMFSAVSGASTNENYIEFRAIFVPNNAPNIYYPFELRIEEK